MESEYVDDNVWIDRPVHSKQSRSLQDIMMSRNNIPSSVQTSTTGNEIYQHEQPLDDEEQELVCSSVSLMGNEADLNAIFGKLAVNDHLPIKIDNSRQEAQIRSLEIEKYDLLSNLTTAHASIKQLRQNLVEMENLEKSNSEALSTDFREQLQSLTVKLDSAVKDNEYMREMLEKGKNDSAELRNEFVTLKTENNRLKMELSMVRNEGVNAGSDVEKLSMENSSLRNQIDALKSSQSSQLRQLESELLSAEDQVTADVVTVTFLKSG